MSDGFITEQEVERALDFLRDNAKEIGAAKERAVKSERMLKHIRALLMKKYNEMPVNAQEREAMADPTYLDALLEEAVAAGELRRMESLREAAALKLGVWQSMSANMRAQKI